MIVSLNATSPIFYFNIGPLSAEYIIRFVQRMQYPLVGLRSEVALASFLAVNDVSFNPYGTESY